MIKTLPFMLSNNWDKNAAQANIAFERGIASSHYDAAYIICIMTVVYYLCLIGNLWRARAFNALYYSKGSRKTY